MNQQINDPVTIFREFSALVCGEDGLSAGLSAVYYEVFNKDPVTTGKLAELLAFYTKIAGLKTPDLLLQVGELIKKDPAMKGLVLDIIKLWYLGIIGSLSKSNDPVPLQGGGYYFHHEALIWKIAQAHPAGLSGGYYGYWSYKPEN